MKIIHDTTTFQIEPQSAIAIGKFHPSAAVFFGQAEGMELTTRYEKRKLFEDMGIDILVEFPLNKETAAMPPEEFVKKILVEQMHAGYIAAGEDLSFGHRGMGNKELLMQMAEKFDYQVQVIVTQS